jgi:putative tricarboxylic transport membrane protein
MSRRGRAQAALATAAIGSFVVGTLATLLLTFVARPIGSLAASFTAADYTALMVLALLSVTALVGRSMVRGLLALLLGVTIGLVGLDPLSGQARLTFDQPLLFDGISEVILIIGLFAIGETLHVLVRGRTRPGVLAPLDPARKGDIMWMSREDWRRSWAPWLRGAAVGFPFGVLPAGGTELPTFLSYTYERKRSKGRRKFGRARSKGSPVRKPRTTRRSPECWCRW